MTIAVGFRCVDGIVLAADSQYTEGITKLDGPKIFPIPSNGHYGLTIAGAGGVHSIKGIARKLEQTLKENIGANPASVSELQEAIEDALSEYYPKHIDSAPKGKRDDRDVQLLIAIWTAKGATRLFETSRTSATEASYHRCIGTGSHLVEYLKDLFFPPGEHPTVEIAKPLAAYIVAMAKKYVHYCGGWTEVRALLDDGTDDLGWKHEVRASEKYFNGFFRNLARLLGAAGGVPLSVKVDIAPYTHIMNERLREFREERLKFRDAHAALRNPKQ